VQNAIKSGLIDKTQFSLFRIYEKMILESRKTLASCSARKRILRDVLDSISISEFIPQNAIVCDVGSGMGFPGIPLAIVRRDLRIDLLEPNPRKYEFLRKVKSKLNLDFGIYRVSACDWHKRYQVIIARRLGSLQKLYKLTEHLVTNHGKLIAFRGTNLALELRQVRAKLIKAHPRKHFNGYIVELQWQ